MKYKISDIRVEADQARIVLEEVVPEGMGDGFARTIPVSQLRAMTIEGLRELIKSWITERRALLDRLDKERREYETAAKEFEGLKGEEIEME